MNRKLMMLMGSGLAAGMLALSPPSGRSAQGPAADAASDRVGETSPSPEQKKHQHPRVSLEIRIDPDALRERLNRSIMRAEQMLERNRAALEKLEAGASASEVLSELRFEGFSRTGIERDTQRSTRDEARDQNSRAETLRPEERAEMQAFLSEYFPDLWANLAPIFEQDPRNANRLLARMSPQIREILFLQKSQPELAEIKIEQMRVGLDFVEASRVYRVALSTPDAGEREKSDALATVRELAASRFDADLRAKQFEIDRLQERLDELKGTVEQIEERRDTEVEHMVLTAVRNAQRQASRQTEPASSGDD